MPGSCSRICCARPAIRTWRRTWRADALARLREIVAELPPRTREIFRLNRLEGLTHAEVARRLEISDSSVQKHLARALAHVMQALEDSR